MSDRVINIVLGGLGGQGVLTASDILADAAFRAGFDVKKSELHGMSQRGGSVSSDVRYGPRVLSPMVPTGEADFLLVLESTQVEVNRPVLRPGGALITTDVIPEGTLKNRKSLNVAMLGALSALLDIPESAWLDAIHARLAAKLHRLNDEAFANGRNAARRTFLPLSQRGIEGDLATPNPITAVKSPPAPLEKGGDINLRDLTRPSC